jgi:hypothetical protein
MSRGMVGALLCCAVMAPGCAGSSAPGPSSHPLTSAAPAAEVLPIGKADLELSAGDFRSPDGFKPALRLSLSAPWHSVHRGDDAFDLGRPAPHEDRPDVAIIFLTPRSGDAEQVVRDVARRFGTSTGRGRLVDQPATTTTVVGGSGQLLRSRGETIGLYAEPGQMVRLLGADVGGSPLVVVVLLPDRARWSSVRSDVQLLLDGVDTA